ncbi:MAG: EamA family transporter [Thermoprotei archaeon]|nr:MAG: EamA family transporter [Thermoprotei archaeon]
MEAVHQGIVLAVIAALIWSFTPSIIRKFSENADPISLNALRAFFATLILTPVITITGIRVELEVQGILFILLSALIGPGVGDIFYIISIRRIGGGRAVAISYFYVFVAQFLAMVLLRETLRPWLVLGTILALTGIILVRFEGGHDTRHIDWFIAFAPAFAWGLGTIVNKFALYYTDPLSLSFLRVAILTIFLYMISFNKMGKNIGRKNVLITAFITGGLGYGVGIPLFLYAIDSIGVSATVLATTLTPVLGRILSSIIAGEKVNLKGVIGTFLVVLGIFIGIWFR